jgi:flagellar basal body-associated protein FliL
MSNIKRVNYLLEGNQVKRRLKKKLLFIMIIIILFIAALLDIIYQGLFFELLPKSIQSYLTGIL